MTIAPISPVGLASIAHNANAFSIATQYQRVRTNTMLEGGKRARDENIPSGALGQLKIFKNQINGELAHLFA